jgi:hypothetical protein
LTPRRHSLGQHGRQVRLADGAVACLHVRIQHVAQAAELLVDAAGEQLVDRVRLPRRLEVGGCGSGRSAVVAQPEKLESRTLRVQPVV